jgi:hypothetical protein
VTDPAGHMYGKAPTDIAPLDADHWPSCLAYLEGIDLFNHGYYWEAHEVWEGLWHAAGRRGTVADFLKGLIKLAAAAVKVREGNPSGVARHAHRAAELFTIVSDRRDEGRSFAGFALDELLKLARTIEDWSQSLENEPNDTRLVESLPPWQSD